MRYRVVQDDIFRWLPKFKDAVLVHICNNIGVWGKGFTADLDRNCPKIGEHFKRWFKNLDAKGIESLGMVHTDFLEGTRIVVASMVAQDSVFSAHNLKPIRYADLIQCMESVCEVCKSANIKEIIGPKFGAGLARGNWAFIEELIQEIWVNSGYDVTIYNYGKDWRR